MTSEDFPAPAGGPEDPFTAVLAGASPDDTSDDTSDDTESGMAFTGDPEVALDEVTRDDVELELGEADLLDVYEEEERPRRKPSRVRTTARVAGTSCTPMPATRTR